MGTRVIGYRNWYVEVEEAGSRVKALGGGNDGSSESRVSRHQNLSLYVISLSMTIWGEHIPERGLTIGDILPFPLQDVKNMEDAVGSPVLV